MNTLGSWIDTEALTGIAKDISPEPADSTPWFSGEETPVTRLMADDFRLPDHFSPVPFPETPESMSAPERSKVRGFLDTIRHKAEQSGLIPRAPGSVAASAAPPPAANSATQASSQPSSPGVIALPPLIAPPAEPKSAAPGWGTTLPASSLPPRRHVPHFEVPIGPLATRLRALTDWIRRQIDASDIFIIDTQGCPISDQEAASPIVAGAILLADAARRAAPHLPSAAEGAIYLDLQDETRLCVIDTSTKHGTFTLGLIVPDALAPRAADRLRRALRRTVEAENQPLSLPPRERW